MRLKIIIAFVLFGFTTNAQSALEYINSLPEFNLPDKFGTSNLLIMSLSSQDYPEIPDDLLNLWEGANVVIVDETGSEFDSTAWYFNDVTKPVGKISMGNDFIVVFFCNF